MRLESEIKQPYCQKRSSCEFIFKKEKKKASVTGFDFSWTQNNSWLYGTVVVCLMLPAKNKVVFRKTNWDRVQIYSHWI